MDNARLQQQNKWRGHYLLAWKIKSNVKEQQEEEKFNDIYTQFPELDSLNILSNQLKNTRNNLREGKEKDDIIKQLDAIRLKEDSIFLIQDSILFDFMQKKPISTVWIEKLELYSIKMLFYKNYKYADELKRLYERFTPKQKESAAAQTIYRYLYLLTII